MYVKVSCIGVMQPIDKVRFPAVHSGRKSELLSQVRDTIEL